MGKRNYPAAFCSGLLDDIYETERQLLYVACTRAREHLLLTGVMPTSEYLADFILQ
jgi:ATP-dependent exoDNAse (exonuclease V) beta subunit